MRECFELEARVTADIESEHIVETFDAGVDEETGAPFLVMELLRGEELGSLLKRRGALPFEEVILLLLAPRSSSSPEVLAAPTRFVTSGVMPTPQVAKAKGHRDAVTAMEPVVASRPEREEPTTSDLTSGSTRPILLSRASRAKPSRLRMMFLIPVSALVLWIGVMVLLQVFKGDAAPSAAASLVLDAGN
jgi:hypothetical protein